MKNKAARRYKRQKEEAVKKRLVLSEKDKWSWREGEDTRVRQKRIQVVSTTTEARAIHQRGRVAEKNKWSERAWEGELQVGISAMKGCAEKLKMRLGFWRGCGEK